MNFGKFLLIFFSVLFFGTFLLLLMIRFITGDESITKARLLITLTASALLFAYGASI